MPHPIRGASLLLLLALAPTSALAQAAPPEAAGGFLSEPPQGGLRGSKLVGVEVIGMDHERVGRTEDVLLDADGRVRAVVIAVGGFLGIGEKLVAVPFDQIAWNMGEAGSGAQPRSSTVPATAPSETSAASAGPETMPGANISNNVLNVIEERRSGVTTEATGSVAPDTQPRGRATVPVAGSTAATTRAEIRQTRAAIQAAPAFRYEAEPKR
ncbi:MAG TPA: PRC-barrel domain-containing protein [Methylobacterium sp.]|jgi:hypothetical protein